MKKLSLVLLGLLLVAALVVTGCQKKAETAAAPAAEVTAQNINELSGTLYYWSCFTGDSKTWDEWRVGEFRKQYPNITVNMQSVPESAGVTNGQLAAAIASGNPPDVISADNYVPTYGMAGQGAFESWAPYLDAIDLKISDFLPGFQNLINFKGVPYLLPQDSNIYMLFINTDMADAAGLDYKNNPPKTMEDLEKWAAALTKKDAAGTTTTYGFLPWIDRGNDDGTLWPFMFGADMVDADKGILELTDPKCVAAFQWLKDYPKKLGIDVNVANGFTKSAGGFFSPDHPFFQGKLAMTVSGNWTTKPLRDYAPNVKYICVPIPAPAGGRYGGTTLGSNVFAIPKGSKRPDLAATFFKFTQNAAINADNFDQWRSIPCTDAEFDDVSWTKAGDPTYLLERQIANSPNSGHPALCAVSAELDTRLKQVRDAMIYDGGDPLAQLTKVQNDLQPALTKATNN
ncbi:MAG: extracellular solute-binding protein [Spirochaetaceae bacterium]|jgi:ABC-type glycerol-3-phosphate transport system substrate-binding protein|nr:extracellular solute-binding protein [Spirochaetaceae bacterium]